MIYLDTNATAPMKPAVRIAVIEAMERWGNASSVHRYGRTTRRYREEARAAVAAMVDVKPSQVVFTSGATEANATILHNFAAMPVAVSAIEHDSVLANASQAARLPVTPSGILDLMAADEILRAMKPGLVSVMLVNNETGIIQPVAELAVIAKKYGHKVHCDAVQAAGRLPLSLRELGVDALSLSSHKVGGPQGMGALVVDEKLALQPIIRGGGQEMNRRAGTENLPGICGFGVAAQLAADDLRDATRLTAWRNELQAELVQAGGQDTVVIGDTAPRVANTLCIAMPGVSSETQVAAMDLAGIAVSAGAACSSGKVKISHVLRAMGYGDDVAGSALRLSLGWHNKQEDIARCVSAWRDVYQRAKNNQYNRSTQAA
ncbi:MAG: cysteine desulfurase [Alphaproteobacteria bacterium]|nr:cysteine desulfurase [Alphaproteobacteria bacterium]